MIDRITIDTWIASLRSGDGDYKKVYTEDYLLLLKTLGLNNLADDGLLEQLNALTMNHSVTGKTTPSQANKIRRLNENENHI